MSPVIKDEREREEVSSYHLLLHSKWSDIEIAKKYKTKNSLAADGYFIFYEELTSPDPGHSADDGAGWVGDDTSVFLSQGVTNRHRHRICRLNDTFKLSLFISSFAP